MKSTLLAALALCAVGVALAQPPNPPTPQQRAAWEAKRMDRLALLLDLNAEQKSQVQTILDTERGKMQAALAQFKASGTPPTRDQMKATRQQLKTETETALSGVISPLQLQKFEALGLGLGGPGRFHHRRPPSEGAPPPNSSSQN